MVSRGEKEARFGRGPDLFLEGLNLWIRLSSQLLPEDFPINLILVQGGQGIPALGQKMHLASMAGLVEGIEGQGAVQTKDRLRHVALLLVEPDETVREPADPGQKFFPRCGDPVFELFAVGEEESVHERSPDLPKGTSHPVFAGGAILRIMEKRA